MAVIGLILAIADAVSVAIAGVTVATGISAAVATAATRITSSATTATLGQQQVLQVSPLLFGFVLAWRDEAGVVADAVVVFNRGLCNVAVLVGRLGHR